MAKSQNVTVEGVNELVRKLRKAGHEDLLEVLKDANEQGVQRVKATAVPMVPVKTGSLLATLRTSATPRQGIVRAGKKKVPYAGPIHWGWPKRNIKPNEFIFKALDRNREGIVRNYEAQLDRLVQMINS